MPKTKLKKPITLAQSATGGTYDRRSIDLTINARVAVIQVDDPLEDGGKLIVLRSLRDDPLAALHSAGQLGTHGEVLFLAGRRWQRCFELAQGDGLRGIDTTRDAVDGGQIARATLSEQQIDAQDDLTKANKALGMEGESIIMDILGRGMTLTKAAAKRSLTSETERKYLGRRFRECLATIAWVFCLTSEDLSTRSGDMA